MDVDEFVNVRLGDGHLRELFAAAGPFDVLSMSELLHGSNGHVDYRRGLVTGQFPRHQRETPGRHRARCGVKSITRLGPGVAAVRNHRPDLNPDAGDARWLDGSGRETPWFAEDEAQNGHDVRGTYGLVSLEHYPLRSLHSYLVKVFRGDVVVENRAFSRRYWRRRDRNEEATSDLSRQQPAFRRELARLQADPHLAELHEACCASHERRIASLLEDPLFAERKALLLADRAARTPEPVAD